MTFGSIYIQRPVSGTSLEPTPEATPSIRPTLTSSLKANSTVTISQAGRRAQEAPGQPALNAEARREEVLQVCERLAGLRSAIMRIVTLEPVEAGETVAWGHEQVDALQTSVSVLAQRPVDLQGDSLQVQLASLNRQLDALMARLPQAPTGVDEVAKNRTDSKC